MSVTLPLVLNASGQSSQFNSGFITPPGYIDGLLLVWNSTSSISVISGSAYVQSLGYALNVSSVLTLSGLSLSASTIYHVYLFNNSGTPAIECVTIAPAAAYNGTARAKTGDTSRRYLGSLLTNSSGHIINFVHAGNQIQYRTNVGAAPLQILSNGRATTATNVACGSVVPVTASELLAFLYNDPTTSATVLFAASDGASVPSGYEGFVASGAQVSGALRLDSSQQFSYAYQTTPAGSAGFTVRVNGFVFQR